jgi:Xaa-Pro aminopeptidase
MEKTTKLNTIQKLKQLLKKNKIDAYIITSTDEFQKPFSSSDRIKTLTNFTGSSGTAIVTNSKCYFFTDGRYTEQANRELNKDFELIDRKVTSLVKWLVSFTKKESKVGFDPKLHSITQIQNLQKKLTHKNTLVPITENLVDLVQSSVAPNNNGSEETNEGTIFLHTLKYSGQSTKDKKRILIDHIQNNNLDAVILTDLTSICWLLNVRAHDLPFAPCMNARLISKASGQFELFTDATANSQIKKYLTNNNVTLIPLDLFEKELVRLKDKKLQLSGQAPYFLIQQLKNYVIAEDPCLLPKACKNKIEIQGAIRAGIKDSRVLINFFKWLNETLPERKVMELDVVQKLIRFRKEQKGFLSPSFPSIVGFNKNAALAHYFPTKSSNKQILGNGLLLIDSGGQYIDGTTDITRTIAIDTPSPEQIHNFTIVLKGHINLITAIFPEGTSGAQLDTLARAPLWKEGKDYEHGTGHGVGSFLAVHEGPQNIVKNYGTVPLKENMIVSIEPGFYKPKDYGIRIENLAYIKKANFSGYLTFEVLTYVHIDYKLINFDMLTNDEANWVKNYNLKCNEIFNNT